MYLSINEIKQLIFSNFPNEKADIVSKHLEHKCFMNNDKLYTLTPNISYEVTTGDQGGKQTAQHRDKVAATIL
jgi:hypothetical protein